MKKGSPNLLWMVVLLLMINLWSFDNFAQDRRMNREAMMKEKMGKDSTDTKKKAKTFQDIITDEAQSMMGMINVHLVGEQHYFEIPESIFGRDIMTVTRMTKTPTGAGYGGEQANRQVIRFEKGPKKKVFIRVINYINVGTDTLQPIYQAVENSNVAPIVGAFDIQAIRKDTSVLIQVDKFFGNPPQIFDLRPFTKQRFNLTRLEKDKSYLESIHAYPINVEIRSVRTYASKQPSINSLGNNRPNRTTYLSGGVTAGMVTFEMNTSMVLLPETPMRRRFYDPRVGIFANRYTVYDDNSQRAKTETFAVRWRLEAKNEADAQRQRNGELIEPKKPIVFYIDPATPNKWRPYLKLGVEDWQVAFEQAGWKNAILARDWPENDTTMSLEDARFSVIRYFASNIQNAYGPNVHDPRSGEIIESHIGWFHNVMRLLKNWYTIQTGAVDPNARPNELSDELMGKLIRFVSAHEVGHTIGLRHNFGASFGTPVEKLRDKAYLDEFSHTSSIMDYARFNYVAQPEDGITDFFPRVAEYDKWAIEWSYKPVYEAADEYEEKKILNEWYKEKALPNPRMHYITQGSPYDPRAQSEDIGDNSMIASNYGIKNLQRILPNIVNWTQEDAEDYELADELYNNVFNQFRRYIGHVTKWVGGVFATPKTSDQEGFVYEPAPSDKQREAVVFLNKHLFQTPNWLLDQKIMAKIRPDQGVAMVGRLQQSTLNNLMDDGRLLRMIEMESAFPNTYSIEDLFKDLRNSIWYELNSDAPMTVYRRNLQKIHLEKLISMMTAKKPSSRPAFRFSAVRQGLSMDAKLTDINSMARGTLKELQSDIAKKVKRMSGGINKYHLEDCLGRITEALDMD